MIIIIIIMILIIIIIIIKMAGVPRFAEYNWVHPDVGLVENSKYYQKNFASLSCGREMRRDIVYPARIESWREAHIA